jgi:hypothetical protein
VGIVAVLLVLFAMPETRPTPDAVVPADRPKAAV